MPIKQLHEFLKNKLHSFPEHSASADDLQKETKEVYDSLEKVPQLRSVRVELLDIWSSKNIHPKKLLEIIKKAILQTEMMLD